MADTKQNSSIQPGLVYAAMAIVIAVPLLTIFINFYSAPQWIPLEIQRPILIIFAILVVPACAFLAFFMKKARRQIINDAGRQDNISRAFQESNEILSDVINFLPDATFVIDRDHRVIIWNRAMEELTGIKAEDMLGKGDYEYALPFYGERRPVLIDLCAADDDVIKKNYPTFDRSEFRLADEVLVPGTVRKGAYLWAIAQPLYDRQGQLIGAIESMRDTTESHEAQEKYATAFKLSPFVLSISSATDGRYLEVSDRFYALTGYTHDEVIGRTAFDLNIWADVHDRDRILAMLREKGHVLNEEIKFRAKNGEMRTMFFSAEIVMITGKPCLLAVNADITDLKEQQETIRRQNEELTASNEEFEALNEELVRSQNELIMAHQMLKQSEEKVSTAFHLAPVILTLSRVSDGNYVEVSDYFLRLTEYTRDEVIGRTSLELNIWVDLEDRNRVLQKIRDGGTVIDEEIYFRSRTGKRYLMLFSAEIINIFEVPHLVSIAVDITERKRAENEKKLLEEQLRQAQKMESIGRLAGGIAHDFNNLLTAIMGNTDFALAHLEKNDECAARLEVVKKAAQSAAQLTRSLLAFSRKEIIEPIIIDVNEMLRGTHSMLSRLIGEDIDLRIETEALGSIKADPGQIEQIIINLAVNARDAMPDGGLLAIHTEDTYLDDAYCSRHAYALPGDYVMISLTDSGRGMSEDVKKNLFEPFFTTKIKGKGTGLGLAMVYGAVKQNNGIIEVYSELNSGTTFKMYFPRAHGGPASGPSHPPVNEKIPKGAETVLLVEDDDMVRDYAAQVLNRLGYTIVQTSSGEEALELIDSFSGTIDLLMTDVILTGMNGKTLAEQISRKSPRTKVLFSSGYTQDIIAERGVLERGINFIGKPYAASALAIKVREVLDSK